MASSVDIATRTITFATDGAVVTETSTDTLTNKTLAAGDNTISGLTNSNLSGSAGITNANLATSSITFAIFFSINFQKTKKTNERTGYNKS